LDKVITRGDRVLIKPNMVGGTPAEFGDTTHPEVVKVVAELSYACGAKEVLVGESEMEPTMENLRRRLAKYPFEQIRSLGSLHRAYKRS